MIKSSVWGTCCADSPWKTFNSDRKSWKWTGSMVRRLLCKFQLWTRTGGHRQVEAPTGDCDLLLRTNQPLSQLLFNVCLSSGFRFPLLLCLSSLLCFPLLLCLSTLLYSAVLCSTGSRRHDTVLCWYVLLWCSTWMTQSGVPNLRDWLSDLGSERLAGKGESDQKIRSWKWTGISAQAQHRNICQVCTTRGRGRRLSYLVSVQIDNGLPSTRAPERNAQAGDFTGYARGIQVVFPKSVHLKRHGRRRCVDFAVRQHDE